MLKWKLALTTFLKAVLLTDCNVNKLSAVRKVCTDVMTEACPQSSFRRLVRKIRKAFKNHNIELEIQTKLVPKLLVNEFYVNAYYCQESDKCDECAIEVIIYHHIKTDTVFQYDQLGQFLAQIYDAVVHELRHQHQGRSRQFKPVLREFDYSDGTEYLADPDEVDAYSQSIAIELIRNLGKTRSLQYLHRASRLSRIRPKGLYASVTLFHYFQTFGDTAHPVIRKLIKKVYLHLLSLDASTVFY